MQPSGSKPLVLGKSGLGKLGLNFAQLLESKKRSLAVFAQTSTHPKRLGFAR